MERTEFKYKRILLTGGSGQLGKAIQESKLITSLLAPPSKILDITKPGMIESYLSENAIDAVIHCAALARLSECERDPIIALEKNIIGTSNLVIAVKRRERISGKTTRFIHISTDGVYPGIRGNYSEKDETIPYSRYGWTKLGAECAVNVLSDFCIIRTSFFNTKNIRFSSSATDVYSSKLPIDCLVRAIVIMLESSFIGTINIGGKRKSDYERYKEFKPNLKPCVREDILKDINFNLACDSSLDISKWNELKAKKGLCNGWSD